MKDLNRSEIARTIGAHTESVVLATALLFLAAGSLWAHFALGPVALERPFVLCWLLVHGGSFLTLWRPRLAAILSVAGLAAINFHLHSSFDTYGMPFFPMAPIFFLIGTAALTSFPWGRIKSVAALWAAGWAGVFAWLRPDTVTESKAVTAFTIGAVVNFVFVAGFLALLSYLARRMRTLASGLGPRRTFDEQRIHADRLQSLGELAASLAHELQNPLTAVNGYSYQIAEDLAEKSPNLELVRKANERIKFNIDRMMELAKVMRGYSRESSRDSFTAISMRAVVSDVLILMGHHLKSSGVELKLDLPERDAWVRGSSVQLGQVLVNLLANARDACLLSERRKVSLGFRAEGARVHLWVEDTGPGIDGSVRRDIYKAFFTTKPVGHGTGLGLYITGLIVERHGGELKFECPTDPAGRVLGTRFTVSFAEAAADSKGQAA